jgi:hypothetical protein
MYAKLVSSNKDVWKSPFFLISLLTPVVMGIALGLAIKSSEGLYWDWSLSKASIELFWDYMKIPIAISSLSIPLASWAIANHRSAQLINTINAQEEKRMHDLFYAHQEHFQKTFGRILKTHKWVYIEEDDLCLIHSQVYDYNIIGTKNCISPNTDILNVIEMYCNNINENLQEFYVQFKSKNTDDNDEFHYNLIYNLLVYLREVLTPIVSSVATKPLSEDASLHELLSAPIELSGLYLRVSTDEHKLDNFTSVDRDTVNAVGHIIIKYLGQPQASSINISTVEGLATISTLKREGVI